MAFLYPAFLLGALAVAVPIVLHLLRRDVAPEVPFTAVHLLRKSPIERSRRRRLRDLLLLAARVAALLLLAAAFARPYAAGATASADLLVIAIDRSFSMGAPGRMQKARELARAALDGRGGTRVAVVAFDERADTVSAAGGAGEARAAIDAIQPGYGATRYASAITRAIELADGAAARLLIVTDLQRAGWEGDLPVAVPATLTVETRDVGASTDNVAVAAIRTAPGAVIATLRNPGASPYKGTVRVSVDGREIAAAPAAVPPGATLNVPVTLQVPGTGVVTVAIDDARGFPGDDIRVALLDPPVRPSVLVVTSGGPSARSGFYLARALETPAAEEGFDARIVTGTEANTLRVDDMAAHAAVVLLSTRGLDRRSRDSMGAFVRSGGGLFIAAGPELDVDMLSTVLGWSPGLSAIEQDDSVLSLAATDLRHPIFRPFGALAANLGQVRFARIWRVRSDQWNVAARFSDGSPALLERQEGNGRVVLFASDLDRRWNDLPLHPSFVPLALETVRYVAPARSQQRDFTVGSVPPGAEARPGAYRDARDRHRVTVNVDTRESAVARVSADEFAAMLQRTDAAPQNPAATRARQTEARQNLWRYGLMLMMVALVAESFVGRQ